MNSVVALELPAPAACRNAAPVRPPGLRGRALNPARLRSIAVQVPRLGRGKLGDVAIGE